MDHLFTSYGRVPQEDLGAEESKLRATIFNISEPLIIMFNEIDDLQHMAVAEENQFSNQQIVNLGFHLIRHTGDFEKGIAEWYQNSSGKDWKAFKSHFEKLQDNLRKVQAPTMKSGVLVQQANTISSHIMQNMPVKRSEYLNTVSTAETQIMNAIGSSTPEMVDEHNKENQQPQAPAANATVTNSNAVMLEVLKLLKDMKKEPTKNSKHCWQEKRENEK